MDALDLLANVRVTLRYRRQPPKFPCIFPGNRESESETGSPMTACTAINEAADRAGVFWLNSAKIVWRGKPRDAELENVIHAQLSQCRVFFRR
jgi:hypothetical protein